MENLEYLEMKFENGEWWYPIPMDVRNFIKSQYGVDIKSEYYPISMSKLLDVCKIAIKRANITIKDFFTRHKHYSKQALDYGVILEDEFKMALAESAPSMGYHKGNELKECDIECAYNKMFSIEVKTAHNKAPFKPKKYRWPDATGNKNYVLTDESVKTKNHFYIIFDYSMKDDGTIHNYELWFGYIKKSDWKIYEKGATAVINRDQVVTHKINERVCLINTPSPHTRYQSIGEIEL